MTTLSGRPTDSKHVILAAHFPGVNNHTVWSDPTAGSQIAFSSFRHLAQTAERGKFDFFFLAEGLRLREQRGLIHDLDVVGRPNTTAILAAIAAVTTHLGLVGTLSTTYNQPYDLARQLATLDHLSAGRAAWNAVTSPDAFTGANFRPGGYLDPALRYQRAREVVLTVRELWDSWSTDAIVGDRAAGRYLLGPQVGAFAHHGDQVDISGRFAVPRSPQGHPVVLQAGDSDGGREFAASTEAYGFNNWSDAMKAKVQLLIAQAKESGAGSISLIPRNDNPAYKPGERDEALRHSLREILPLLEKADMVALVEPLGFTTSSLRRKADTIAAIEAVGGSGRFLLVHDTFHHHLAGETQFFPKQTGIVHISGVVDPALAVDAMQDGHRILVDARDRLGNIAQIKALIDGGFEGAFSYEPFSPEVHSLKDPKAALRASMDYIAKAVA